MRIFFLKKITKEQMKSYFKNNWIYLAVIAVSVFVGVFVGCHALTLLIDIFQLEDLIVEIESIFPWFKAVLYILFIITGIVCSITNGPIVGAIKVIVLSFVAGIIIWVAMIIIAIVMTFAIEPTIMLPLVFIIGLMIPTTITIWVY